MDRSQIAYVHPGIYELLKSGRSLLLIQTQEEDRLHQLLETLAERFHLPLWQWQLNRGLEKDGESVEECRSPQELLDRLLELEHPPFVWLKDFHHHYTPETLRSLRDIYYRWRDLGGALIMSGTTGEVPADLEREMAFYALDTPSRVELRQYIGQWLQGAGKDLADQIDLDATVACVKGLTLAEVRHALSRLDPGTRASEVLGLLQEEKRILVQSTGTLEYIPHVPRIDQLGGLDNLKEWLLKRRRLLFSDDAATQDIAPKGILLMGVSGCGKSLCIKAISSAWQIPLYRLEMVKVFSGGSGGPELAFARACKTMEEMAPAILWIDEIEMGLSGEGSTASDSVMSRLFAFFLTWMQEKPPGLFVAATANRIDLLPAEMIRKGRFDQVFFVDLPTLNEREAIFRIHLSNRGFDPDAFELEVFADSTKGWNGAEIEQCVIAAITASKMENRDLELRDMYLARKQIVPISTTMEEQVRHIRNWAYERAIRASLEQEH